MDGVANNGGSDSSGFAERLIDSQVNDRGRGLPSGATPNNSWKVRLRGLTKPRWSDERRPPYDGRKRAKKTGRPVFATHRKGLNPARMLSGDPSSLVQERHDTAASRSSTEVLARVAAILLLVLFVLATEVPRGVAPSYIVTDLGTFGTVQSAEAFEVNESGQVVGRASNRAFLWQGGSKKMRTWLSERAGIASQNVG